MNTLSAVLAAWGRASGRDAALWEWGSHEGGPVLVAATDAACDVAQHRPESRSKDDIKVWAGSRQWIAEPAGNNTSPAWLVFSSPSHPGPAYLKPDLVSEAEIARTVAHIRRLERERDGATEELAERYEEISLLYAIGELLGSGASVESVASTVLNELLQTVGVPRGALMLHDAERDVLLPIALHGAEPSDTTTASVEDSNLIVSRAFRTGESFALAGGIEAQLSAPILASDGGPVLAVPIRRISAEKTSSLGALLLAGNPGDAPFSAGDRKLVTAVASQVGAALHNARLVRAALDRERFVREMKLAHDLQLKLLPDPSVLGPEARAAAKVVPAESVGGDFYQFVRLNPDKTGVVIGDVSGHGYQAALVMALTMSAAAIHVQAVIDPAVALSAIRDSLADELESTEMSITVFYAVIDGATSRLRYANAGHPHAFILHENGNVERLVAQVPPLGFSLQEIRSSETVWSSGDRLLLFTDGIPDALNSDGAKFGEEEVLTAAESVLNSSASPSDIVNGIINSVRGFTGSHPLIDDLAVVVVDRMERGSD